MTKPYFCRVEYLESTGTQYINTGVTFDRTKTTQVKTTAMSLSTDRSVIISAYYDINYNDFAIEFGGTINNHPGAIRGYTKLQNTAMNIWTPDLPINIKKSIDFTYNPDLTGTLIYDGITLTGTVPSGTQSAHNPLCLFLDKRPDTGNISHPIRIYYLQLIQNNVLVRDFIPVLDNSGRPAMYDQVSGQLFYNQGTGEFNCGRKIIPVEYLESTGTQYIDTRYIPTNNTSFELSGIDMDYTAGTTRFGSRVSSTSENYCFTVISQNSFRFTYGSGTSTGIEYVYNTKKLAKLVSYNSSTKICTVTFNDDTTEQSTSFAGITPLTSSAKSLYLFGFNNNNSVTFGKSKQNGLKLYENGTLVRDFIPAIDENNVGFMFDKVSNTIYDNAGTGQFKVGPNVERKGNKKLLRKKLALMLANLKKKRKFFCELEYLKSTGTQYIDTGIYPNTNTKATLIIQQDDATRAVIIGGREIGASTQTGFKNGYAIWSRLTAGGTRFDYGGTYGNVQTTGISLNTKHRFTKDGVSNFLDGVQQTSNVASPFTGLNTLYLFGMNNGGTADFIGNVKMYYCKIWDNGTLVRDLIPVLDWDMTPCMYDKVTEQLFYNAGTGDFVAGRQIHPVEYLESTGTQYIDTGLNYWADFEIGVKLRENASNVCMSNGQYSRLQRNNAENPYWVFTGGQQNVYRSNIPITEYHSIKWKNLIISVDGAEITTLQKQLNSGYTLYMFANQNGLAYPNMIYFCKLWNPTDGTLVRDFIPMVDESGVGALFDKVTHTIFDNAGTGAFKYPAREIGYLESTGTQYIDTGHAFTDNFAWEIDFEGLTKGATLFGGRTSSIRTAILFSYDNQLASPIAGLAFAPTPFKFGNLQSGRHKIKMSVASNKGSAWVDGVQMYNDTAFDGTYISGVTQAMFANNYGSGNIQEYASSKVYALKMWQGSDLVRDFIPCYKDGVAGMWDKVNSVFYPNAGSGSFSAGRILEPEYE